MCLFKKAKEFLFFLKTSVSETAWTVQQELDWALCSIYSSPPKNAMLEKV